MWLKFIFLFVTSSVLVSAYETVYTENYGPDAKDHTDVTKVTYKAYNNFCQKNNADRTIYTNVPAADQELYHKHCEYYRTFQTTSIPLPLSQTGHYILIQKFIPRGTHRHEVTLNGVHTIMRFFQALESSGASDKAYDEVTLFSICEDRLWYKGESSTIVDNSITLRYLAKEGRIIDVSAVGLFKRDNGAEFPFPNTATNFQKGDLDRQLQFECKGNELVKVDVGTKGPNYYLQNNTFNFIFNFNSYSNEPKKTFSIDESEIYRK